MEKILLAMNSQRINYSVIEFAHYVAKLTGSKITGIFIEPPISETISEIIEIQNDSGSAKNGCSTKTGKSYMSTEQSILFFKDACTKERFHFEVFRDQVSHLEDLIFESRFADLLIIDADASNTNIGESNYYAKEILTKAECPVIITPASFKGIDEVVFCYDGSRSAVFAIKQFTYLFPQFNDKKIVVLEVNEESISTIYEKEKIRGLLKGHYSQIGFQVLNGDPTIELFTYLLQKKDAFIVMGAYGRKLLSNILNSSRADLVLRITDLPFFITHV